ncbi:MAG TPA: alpha/beta hydrolase [Solirubrobacteraceae bacterium]|nr:alpha/beta hydrolase [Solirubrobacteraceae bacterium]
MGVRRVRMADGTELHTVEAGRQGDPVLILLHGFPELGYSWRRQIGPLADAGYRVIVPDLRGFGSSDVPPDVAAYSIDVLSRDVTSLLDAAGAEHGVLIGHDWGADVAWKTAWMHPDRIAGVAGLSVPFVPRAPAPPVQIMRQHLGEDFYIVWFQEPGVAEPAMSRDVRRTISTPRVWDPAWVADAEEDPPSPPFMTEEDLAVYVEAFERTGFAGGLAYYRNIDRNWELTADLDGRRIDQPAMFLTGERDPVRQFMPAEGMDGWVTDLRAHVVVPGAGHWVNQEAPREVNRALLAWLGAIEEREV